MIRCDETTKDTDVLQGMTSLLSELKRRNVFRVAVAYIVVGWVVLQVAEFLAPLLQLPEWTVSLALFIGIIGFPFALIFAWAFELTPEGLKRTADVSQDESITAETGRTLNRTIISLMAIAILLLLAERFYDSLSGDVSDAAEAGMAATETAEGTGAVAQEGAGPKSIAVLPFTNMSDDAAQEYFSDGISEELLNGLAQLRDLKVAARTSSFAFKGRTGDIKGIGEQLNVDTVLEGSVRTAGTRVRITAQLINVEDGYHLWSETYDRELDDIFAIQDEISRAIVSALKVHLMDGEAPGDHRAVNLEAYNFYLQAQHNLRQRTETSLQRALRQHRKAVDIDPGYADALAGQAAATLLLSESSYGSVPEDESRRRAQALLDRAFDIQAGLPRALAIQALLDMEHKDPYTALESIDRAIAANPSEGILIAWKSSVLNELGRSGEADLALEQAYRVDPLHHTIRHNLAMVWVRDGQLARARELVTPGSELAYEVDGWAAWTSGRLADASLAFGKALELAEAEAGNITMQSFRLAATYMEMQLVDEARAHAPRLMQTFLESFTDPASALARLEQVPVERRGHNLEDAMALAMIRLGRCDGVVDVYGNRGYLDADQPLWGDLREQANNIRDAALFGWCLKTLGREGEAGALGLRLERYIQQVELRDQGPEYMQTLADVQILLGKQDEAMVSLKHAWQSYGLHWFDLEAPPVATLAHREDFRALQAAVYEHINAERAQLGHGPAEIPAPR